MVDVFISYSRDDLAAVTRIAEAVEAAGYEVWWDADLPPHLSYGDVITAKIGMAKAAIVVWSRASVASEWVRAEADMARNQKKLVQTALDNVMPPLPFNQIQFAELGDWNGDPDHPGWRKVLASLAELCGQPGISRPMAPGRPVAPAQSGPPAPLPAKSPQLSRNAVLIGLGAFFAVALALVVGVKLGGGGAAEDTSNTAEIAALVSPLAPTPTPSPTLTTTAASEEAEDDEENRHVLVMNMSSQTMRELYASPITSDTWEEDLLGQRTLAAGEDIDANIDNGTDECMYDLKAVMANDREYIQRSVNVCSVSRWVIGDGGDSVS